MGKLMEGFILRNYFYRDRKYHYYRGFVVEEVYSEYSGKNFMPYPMKTGLRDEPYNYSTIKKAKAGIDAYIERFELDIPEALEKLYVYFCCQGRNPFDAIIDARKLIDSGIVEIK